MDRRASSVHKPALFILIFTLIVSIHSFSQAQGLDSYPTPAHIEIISGNGQVGAAGVALSQPFVVEVSDFNGRIITGTEVRFTAIAGGGTLTENPDTDVPSLPSISVETDPMGRARATLIPGSLGQINVVEARAWNIAPVIFTATVVSSAPTLNPIGNKQVSEGSILTFTISATDTDGGTLTFSASGMPSGASLIQQPNAYQATFTWMPGYNTVTSGSTQDFYVTFTVSDPWGGTDSEQIVITVINVNPPTAPDIRISPTSIDFGSVGVGGSVDKLFYIYNDGTASLAISSITSTDLQFKVISYSQNNTQFTNVAYSQTDPQLAIGPYPIINPGASLLIKARFTPTSSGPKSAQLVISSNDPDEPVVSIFMQGQGTQLPEIRVTPASIDFGEVEVDKSAIELLHINNDGNSTLRIYDIISTDSQFTVPSNYSATQTDIPPGTKITVSVTFKPASAGSKAGELIIVSNDADEPIVSIPLQGKGIAASTPDIRVSPSSINFGQVQVGQSSYKGFQVYNDGNATLIISSITSNSSQFTVSNTQITTASVIEVEPNEMLSVPIKFAPTSAGDKSGVITVASNDPDEPTKTVSVQGEGTPPPTPNIRLSPSALDFGEVDVGRSLEKQFWVYNDGDATLKIFSIDSDNTQFAVTMVQTSATSVIEVEPGGILPVPVTFAPSSSGVKTGTITVVNNDPDESSKELPVQGEGVQVPLPDIRVSSASIKFGDVEVGRSLSILLRIYNDGDAALLISSITSNNSQFAVLSYTSSVPPGSSVTVPIKFSPTSAGTKAGKVTIISNDPDDPSVAVNVQGKGIDVPLPDIRISPSSINFGEVHVSNSLDKNFWIYNDGEGPLEIYSIASTSSQFQIIAYTANVPSGGTTSVLVRFIPSSVGTKTATITVKSNDPDEPTKTVSVQGKGAAAPLPDIRVSPTSLNYGEVQVGQSSDKTFRIYNDGDGTLEISSITSSNSQFSVVTIQVTTVPIIYIQPGGMATIHVSFNPLYVGLKTGVITMASNDPDEPSKTVSVQGIGVNFPVPDIRVSTYSINFGDVPTGSSRDKEFRIYNDGNDMLYIYDITSDDSRFEVLSEPDVAPGGMEEVTIRFSPPWIGTYYGTITIESNDPDESEVYIDVEGKGIEGTEPDIHVSPYVIDFGDVELGQSSEKTFLVYNLGDAVLQIYSMTSNDYQFDAVDYSNVDPDDSVTATIRFTPSLLGSQSGTITIYSNDPNESSVTVWVYGEGIYPQSPVSHWDLIRQQNLLSGLEDVHFVNKDEGWVVGSGGTIAHSVNGGEMWNIQSSGTSRALRGVHFTNSNNGWAVGQYGTILRTTNGGISWSPQSSGGLLNMNSVKFVSQSRGWIAGEAGEILTTSNGYSWTSQDSETSFDLNDVCFVNSYRGWAVGNYGTIIYTNNSGQNWLPQDSNTNSILHGVDFVSYYDGWAVGGYGTILHTEDGGLTWDAQDSGLSYSTLLDVDFVSSSEGWVVGYNGLILYTTDGGETWDRVDISEVDETLRSVYFHDANNGWAVGAYGTILRYSSEPAGPPYITSVTVSGSPAHAGEVITVTAKGQAQNLAKFSINGVVTNVAMTENPPGTYTGYYTAQTGVNATNATVIVTLTNSQGEIATDSSRTVTIDTSTIINWSNVTPTTAKAGDTVTVSMGGEAGGTATFSIETVVTDVSMTEVSYIPGRYTGSYPVPQGTNADDVKVTVKLTDEAGNVETQEAGRITIDTVAQITSISVDGSPAKFGVPIVVILTGEPGGIAKFSIDNLVSDVSMSGNYLGVYTGSYTAPMGTDVKDAMLTVHLTDALGNTSTQDAEKVTIDTISTIESVIVTGSPAKANQIISVTMTGERNGTARFSISGVVSNVTMSQVAYYPGQYKGSYTVPSNAPSVTNAVVTVTLTDGLGNVATDTSKRVTIDTKSPVVTSASVSGSPAKAGGIINVTVVSESGLSAGFSIAGAIYNVPMPEMANQPGHYTGSYTVTGSKNMANAIVTITLTDAVGNVSSDTSQRVTMDTKKPYITSVSISGSPAKFGETISIVMVGESGGSAQFTIVGLIDNVPMPEMTNQPGRYKGTYTVVYDDLSINNAVLSAMLADVAGNVETDSSKRVSIYPAWDANTDGVIGVSDLLIVGMFFGQSVPAGSDADVNSDGRVDVLDVIIICRNFGDSSVGASPGRETEKVSPEQLAILEKLYDSVQATSGGDADIATARKLLSDLISLNTVKIDRSQLMQNYPNPFNPETWIPYELAESGHVTIGIYSSSGQLIRSLDLGHRDMGSYVHKDKAAYWDGMNESGENAASGIYFYVIQSGDFTATKKMIINR